MANQRERSRVKTVKESLENLRAILPSVGKQKKMSQLQTLKHAVDYIQCLESKLIEDSDQNSTTFSMLDHEKYVMDPTIAFDSQVFENFVAVDNPPEQDVILNFDLTKLEEYSVVGPTTSGSAQSISGSGNQVQVAVPADTPQVAPQPGKISTNVCFKKRFVQLFFEKDETYY